MDTDQKIEYIRRHINTIPVQDRRAVLMAMVSRGKTHKLKPCSSGIVFDAYQLEPEDVDAMYNILDFNLNKHVAV